MTSKFLLIAAIVFLTLGFQSEGCSHRKDDKRVIGPSQPVSLAIYFKKGTTNDEVNSFWENVLRIEEYNLAVAFRIIKDDYEGVAVSFSTKTTSEQREQLIKAVKESPIVYKVFENVVPSDVKLE
jgi:hypothetical protein